MAVEFLGFGKYIARKIETNAEVAARLGIGEDEIIAKSGVKQRFIARDETASEMALHAINEALADAKLDPAELDAVIVATFSGDYLYPNAASGICRQLGVQDCAAFDIQANCSGFQIGLETARNMLLADPSVRHVAVVGVARQSPYLDPNDINTAYFFSDGSSAAIVGRAEGEGGLLKTFHRTNGRNYEIVRLRAGGSSYPLTQELLTEQPETRFYEHAGLAVWKEVIVEMPKLIKKAMAEIGWERTDLDLVLMHQANLRLIDYVLSRLGLSLDSTLTNIEEIGNTADASLGTVIYDAAKAGRLEPGMKIMLASVGAGFVYAATPYVVTEGIKR